VNAKINKSLDYNKLIEQHSKGKLLGTQLKFPLYASIKYDGNYVVVHVKDGQPIFETSGGLFYRHTNGVDKIFKVVQDGCYIAERIANDGKLGDRKYCTLVGPKTAQLSYGHSYKVFDYISNEDYLLGRSSKDFKDRMKIISDNIDIPHRTEPVLINSINQLREYFDLIISQGYEGLMLMQSTYRWRDTKSRTTDIIKYKNRPTVDLICIGTTEGEGKYAGMIGALILKDHKGRVVNVGSGLDDYERSMHSSAFIGKVVEIQYEQILDTYIQPAFIRIRTDKTKGGID